MPQHGPRSLKYEYQLYVENEIENYKESVSRSAILKIGDEAAAALLDASLQKHYAELKKIPAPELLVSRYNKFRNMAQFYKTGS